MNCWLMFTFLNVQWPQQIKGQTPRKHTGLCRDNQLHEVVALLKSLDSDQPQPLAHKRHHWLPLEPNLVVVEWAAPGPSGLTSLLCHYGWEEDLESLKADARSCLLLPPSYTEFAWSPTLKVSCVCSGLIPWTRCIQDRHIQVAWTGCLAILMFCREVTASI